MDRGATRQASAEPGTSAPEDIVQDIIAGLYRGRYAPGQRLSEAELTSHYGVGRTTIRECLNRLAATGVIVMERHRGAAVRKADPAQVVEALEILELLYGLAASAAAKNRSQAALTTRFRAAAAGVIDYDPRTAQIEYRDIRQEFYAALRNMSCNSELIKLIPHVELRLIGLDMRLEMAVPFEVRVSDYRAISAAVLAGKPAEAERAMRIEVARISLAVIEHFRPADIA